MKYVYFEIVLALIAFLLSLIGSFDIGSIFLIFVALVCLLTARKMYIEEKFNANNPH